MIDIENGEVIEFYSEKIEQVTERNSCQARL